MGRRWRVSDHCIAFRRCKTSITKASHGEPEMDRSAYERIIAWLLQDLMVSRGGYKFHHGWFLIAGCGSMLRRLSHFAAPLYMVTLKTWQGNIQRAS